MLNIRISQAQFDALSEQERAHYVKRGEQFVLDTNGDTDEMVSLRQQNVKLHNDILKATSEASAANAKVATAEQDAEAKYKTQLDTANATVESMRTSAVNTRRDAIVAGIANQFNQPELFSAAVKGRVDVSFNDKGEMVEKFVNEKGEVITLEQLTDSYCKNPAYAAMLVKPTTVTTMPTDKQPSPTPSPTNTPLFAPQQGGQGGQGGQAATWGYGADKKPVIYDYGKMSDADTKQYLEAKVAYDSGKTTT